jgi:hypothetical protein
MKGSEVNSKTDYKSILKYKFQCMEKVVCVWLISYTISDYFMEKSYTRGISELEKMVR